MSGSSSLLNTLGETHGSGWAGTVNCRQVNTLQKKHLTQWSKRIDNVIIKEQEIHTKE
jgi:hypothetical protein